MASDEQLTYGLCPACFCVDFDNPGLSYEDRPIADIVAGSKIGCTFCGLLTYSLNLKNGMARSKDASMAWVHLSRYDPLRGADNENCITAESHDHSLLASIGETATFDITIIRNQDETPEEGKARTNSLHEDIALTLYHSHSFSGTWDTTLGSVRIRTVAAYNGTVIRLNQKAAGQMHYFP